MNLWYFFGGLFVFMLAIQLLGKVAEALPQKGQNVVAFIMFLPVLLLMGWAVWFMFTGQVAPSFNSDYIKR